MQCSCLTLPWNTMQCFKSYRALEKSRLAEYPCCFHLLNVLIFSLGRRSGTYSTSVQATFLPCHPGVFVCNSLLFVQIRSLQRIIMLYLEYPHNHRIYQRLLLPSSPLLPYLPGTGQGNSLIIVVGFRYLTVQTRGNNIKSSIEYIEWNGTNVFSSESV